MKNIQEKIEDSILDQVWNQVEKKVEEQVMFKIWNQINNHDLFTLWQQVADQVKLFNKESNN